MLAAMELVLRSNARSELERWLAALHAADQQVPSTREKGAVVVPLKVVRTPVTKPVLVNHRPRRMLTAALTIGVVLLGADRAWEWWGSAAAETVAEVAPQVATVAAAPAVPDAPHAVVEVGDVQLTVQEEEKPSVQTEPPALEV